MSLTRPFSSLRDDLTRIFNEMDQEFFSPALGGRRPGLTHLGQPLSLLTPPVDIVEEENEIKVTAQVPGIKPEDIDIEVDDNTLVINAETVEKEETTEGNVHRKEIISGKFFRRVPLPTEVEGEKAKASFENGLLKVTIPKSKVSRRHKIKVGNR